jgi:small multidrug resistance pump
MSMESSMKSQHVAWLVLAASVVSEVAGTVALKRSAGFTKPFPAAMACCFYLVAVWLMSLSMRHLEVGVTYAVWAASGTAVIALVGMAFYGEQVAALKLWGLLLVTVGVILLSLGVRA